MKKSHPKRQRIPRRGPGVAELEKILKEQQGGQDSDTQFQDISPPPPPPPPPPLPLQVPFLPPSDYSSWSNLPLFPTLDLIPPPLPTTAAATGKSVFPTDPKYSDTQMNIPPHFFPNFQVSSLNRQYYNSMVNFTPGSASSAARYFHQIEHPSSQRSTDYNHILTSPEEQEQIGSGKRARSFMEEKPNFESTRISNVSNIMPLKHSSSSSSSSPIQINIPTAINFHSNFRDEEKKGFAEQLLSSTNSNVQLTEDSRNLRALRSSSSTQNQFPPFHTFQETMAASQHRDGGGSALADYNKIAFNSSLYVSNSKLKGSTVASISSEAKTEDDIDLDLKL